MTVEDLPKTGATDRLAIAGLRAVDCDVHPRSPRRDDLMPHLDAYWREIVERVGAKRIIPIHWDSLTGPIEGPFTGPVRAAGFLGGGADENDPSIANAK